jgi:hypothetical protein
MGKKEDTAAYKTAVKKLQTYCKGLPKNSVETPKYLELNAEAERLSKKVSWWNR